MECYFCCYLPLLNVLLTFSFFNSLGVWRPYKELQAVVERSLYKKSPEVYHELEVSLKKFKPDFISLLKNPVSSVQFAVDKTQN